MPIKGFLKITHVLCRDIEAKLAGAEEPDITPIAYCSTLSSCISQKYSKTQTP